jgi:hypothetical protein
MNRSAVRGGVLGLEHGEVVLTYNDDDDDPWVELLRWLRTGDCGGFVKEDDNAVRVPPRDFLGDKGAPRSEIMLVGMSSSLLVVTSFWLLLLLLTAGL